MDRKPLPDLRSDDEAERFVAKADLTEYDLSSLRPVRFEFEPELPRPLPAPSPSQP